MLIEAAHSIARAGWMLLRRRPVAGACRIFVLTILLCLPREIFARTHVLLTIDVESFQDSNPARDTWGKLEGYDGEWGIGLILRILQEHHARATFYLNVYESAKFGEDSIGAVAREIVRSGQDLQLHTPPRDVWQILAESVRAFGTSRDSEERAASR
jgi:hypothetical protein